MPRHTLQIAPKWTFQCTADRNPGDHRMCAEPAELICDESGTGCLEGGDAYCVDHIPDDDRSAARVLLATIGVVIN